jgi:uncharacterized membrane protein
LCLRRQRMQKIVVMTTRVVMTTARIERMMVSLSFAVGGLVAVVVLVASGVVGMVVFMVDIFAVLA